MNYYKKLMLITNKWTEKAKLPLGGIKQVLYQNNLMSDCFWWMVLSMQFTRKTVTFTGKYLCA